MAIVLSSPNLWLLGGAMNCRGVRLLHVRLLVPEIPRVGTRRRTDQGPVGYPVSILAGGAIGCLIGGVIRQLVACSVADRRRVRRIIGAADFSVRRIHGCFCGDISMTRANLPVATSLFTAMALLAGQVQLTAWWATAADISGKHLAAMFGLMNSMGGFAAFASQRFLRLVRRLDGWPDGYSKADAMGSGFCCYSGVYVTVRSVAIHRCERSIVRAHHPAT